MITVDQIIEAVLANEGGYVHDVNDAGGETNFGITIKVAQANGYHGAMRELPRDFAKRIYRIRYVTGPRFDQIVAIDADIGAELVDTGVNMGPAVAATFLQRSLNGLNRGAKDYADIIADGMIGPATIGALKAYVAKRGAEGRVRLLKLLNALQGARYLSLAEGRAANEAFLFGWLDRI